MTTCEKCGQPIPSCPTCKREDCANREPPGELASFLARAVTEHGRAAEFPFSPCHVRALYNLLVAARVEPSPTATLVEAIAAIGDER